MNIKIKSLQLLFGEGVVWWREWLDRHLGVSVGDCSNGQAHNQKATDGCCSSGVSQWSLGEVTRGLGLRNVRVGGGTVVIGVRFP